MNVTVLFGTYLLNASRTTENDFDTKQRSVMNLKLATGAA
jgi:hypothetical protein